MSCSAFFCKGNLFRDICGLSYFFFKGDQRQSVVPKKFRGKELTEDQRSSLNEGKTVRIDGLVDKKGKEYGGYITLIKTSWAIEFMFPKEYKQALDAGLVTPDDRAKTPLAVTSDGKTDETARRVKTDGEQPNRGQAGQSGATEVRATNETAKVAGKEATKEAAREEYDKPKRSQGRKM